MKGRNIVFLFNVVKLLRVLAKQYDSQELRVVAKNLETYMLEVFYASVKA